MTTIKKDTLTFLKNIKANNTREWFTEHKPNYVIAKDDVKDFGNALMKELNNHDHIEQIKVYRIYRDVRFSKDKTPYKTNIGCSFVRATEKLRGGCYLQIEPGNSFVGGGFWGPETADLKRIRNEFVQDASEFRDILASDQFIKYFGMLEGDALKTAPRGFDKQHPNIDLIRMKQFLIGRKFTDKEVTSANFLKECNETFKAMRPFFDYMSDVLTTNENGESIL